MAVSMSPISTPRPPPAPPAESCPSTPLAPAIILLFVIALLCEHTLRRPRLPRTITQTLVHRRAAEIAETDATRRDERNTRPR